MSGPVPSPSMNGMIGWSGTVSLPSWIVIFWPCGGTFSLSAVDINLAPIVFSLSRNAARPGMLAQAAPHGPRHVPQTHRASGAAISLRRRS